MIVKLISDYGHREKIISRNAEFVDVIELIDQLDWNFFYQIEVQKDKDNWIEIGGSLFEDGFAVILSKDGNSSVLEKSPENLKQIKAIIRLYFEGELSEIKDRLQIKHNPDIERKSFLRDSKLGAYFSLGFLLILGAIFILILGHFGNLNGILMKFSKTDYARAEVINEQLILRKGTHYVKIVEIKYLVNEETYSGKINVGINRTGIEVGDHLKIEYRVSNPEVYQYIGKYVKQVKSYPRNSIEAKRLKDSLNQNHPT